MAAGHFCYADPQRISYAFQRRSFSCCSSFVPIFRRIFPLCRVLPDGTVRQVYFYCVDISEFTVNKLSDRGSLSARGIVTNAQDFIVNLAKGLDVF